MSFRPRSTVLRLLIAGCGLAPVHLAAWAQAPAVVTRTMETTGTIESVDATTRQVLFHRDDGALISLVAGPEVANFAQMKPGDRVWARYESALAARIGKPGQSLLNDTGVEQESGAALGDKPYGEHDLEIHSQIKVTGIDLDHNTLAFVGPANVPRVVDVRTPQMQAFLRTLQVGDYVDVAFREAAVVDVHPAD
jgi:hypothetical protein